MKALSDVKNIFNEEFGALSKKFNVIEMNISEASNNGDSEVNRPGVYVFWHPEHRVIKVGKSQSNSKKRALEHIRDNTNKGDVSMKAMGNDKDTMLLLFNVINNNDLHWLLSLEALMEWKTSPSIPAARMG